MLIPALSVGTGYHRVQVTYTLSPKKTSEAASWFFNSQLICFVRVCVGLCVSVEMLKTLNLEMFENLSLSLFYGKIKY